jgi:putative nucleotidyltransferase with HDIG domain
LAIASPSLSSVPADSLATPAGRHNEGHGRRLTMAFEALESYPVLVESRNRVLRLFESGRPSISDLVAAVEADLALTVTVVRLANQLDGPTRGRIDSVVAGVEALSVDTIHAIASRARTFDFFERTAVWQGIPERLRLHAIATQRAADRLGREIGYDNRDRLMVTSLLHDIGKLVLVHAYPGYPEQVHGDAKTPEDRLRAERRELGVDHSLVGGVLARRWGLPRSIASVIERHHAEDAADEAAIVRLADMLAHYMMGGTISSSEILAVSRTVELSPTSLRTVMYELPLPTVGTRPRQVEPCPMSAREIDVLRRLAKGMVYKQIASELGLSTSTIRTHLHNVYGKLGAMDRAQAVLMATERGWI